MKPQPTYGSVTIDPWRSATRHICSIVECAAPCTTEPFGWRVLYDHRGNWLRKRIDVEAFFCEHHEAEMQRAFHRC
jgi:hypothetical protein